MLNCNHKEIKLLHQHVIKYLIIVTMYLGNWNKSPRCHHDFVVGAFVERPIITMKTGSSCCEISHPFSVNILFFMQLFFTGTIQ